MNDPFDKGERAGLIAGQRSFRLDLTRRMKNWDLPVGADALKGALHMESLRLGLEMKVYPNGEAIEGKARIIKPSREDTLLGLRMGVFASEDAKDGISFLKEKAYPIARDGEWFDYGTLDLQHNHNDWRPFAEAGLVDLPYPKTSFRANLTYEIEGRAGSFETIWIAEQIALGMPIALLTLTLRRDKDERPLILTSFRRYEKGALQAHKLVDTGMDQVFFMLWMILNTKGVEKRVVQPDEKLNKARERNGKDPLKPYTVVDTKAYITALRETERMEEEDGGTHASPRPHLRRAHLRHLSGDRIVPVMACIVNGSSDLAVAVRDKYSVERKP